MTANQQLTGFLKKYDPKIIAGAKKALARMRKLVPGATEMVYDNYNALVIGFGPSEKASLAVFSLALFPDHISLCFLQGVGLPDPGKRLLGSGNVARHVKLIPLSVLDEKEIRELITVAMNRAKEPIDPEQKRKMVIKSISKKQRPRRP
jgi:hypothetical protein